MLVNYFDMRIFLLHHFHEPTIKATILNVQVLQLRICY